MTIKIDRRLNLVIPVEREDATFYVHAAPVSRDVFETHFLIMAQTMTALITEGLGAVSGPRVAAIMMRTIAQARGGWEGQNGVKNGLFAEMRRLSNVVMPGANGWDILPLDTALARELLDEDEVSEVENALVYFTLASSIYRKADQPVVIAGAARIWGARTESSNAMEFARSLPTLTPDANIGASGPLSADPTPAKAARQGFDATRSSIPH